MIHQYFMPVKLKIFSAESDQHLSPEPDPFEMKWVGSRRFCHIFPFLFALGV
jgi:hypothetical protein